VPLWRELLLSAITGDEETLEKVRMQGVQLLATELRLLELVAVRERDPADKG
jgi:hypothetical protein